MVFDLTRYVAQVKQRYIDVDGVFGAQCWDQWSHYAMALGVPVWPTYTNAGGTAQHPGWACNVYHNARSSGLLQWFEILPATATPRAGDVAFWELGSAWFPLSHVATVLSVPRPGMVRCLTQNPGAVQISDLVTRGIIGYLRPRQGIRYGGTVTRTPAIPASEKRARVIDQEEEDGMYKPTVHIRRETATDYEAMRAHPLIGQDLKPGTSRKDGRVTVFKGYEVTTDKTIGTAWARMHARGVGGETSTTNRAGYIAIQAEARRIAVELTR